MATDPSQSNGSWRYCLPARAILWILSALFLSSALFKIGGTWLIHKDFLPNLMLQRNIEATLFELPLNPLASAIYSQAWLNEFLRYQTLLFEGLFFLALLGPRLRDFMVALALTFHAVNALWIVVTFTPVMVVYGMFIDWHQLWQRIGWRWLPPQMYRLTQCIDQIPESGLVAGLFGVAILTGFSWNTDLGLRPVFNWGGMLDWRTIWWPVLPIALIWLGFATIRLISVLLTPLSTRLGR